MSWARTASHRPAIDGTSQSCADGWRACAQRHPRASQTAATMSSRASRSTRWPPVSDEDSVRARSSHGSVAIRRVGRQRGRRALARAGRGTLVISAAERSSSDSGTSGTAASVGVERQGAVAGQQPTVQRLVAQARPVARRRLGRCVGDLQVGQQRAARRGGRRASRPSGPGARCRRARRRSGWPTSSTMATASASVPTVKIGRNSSTTTTPAGRGPLAQLAEALRRPRRARPGRSPRARAERRARRRRRRRRRRDRGPGRGSPARCRAA